MNMKPLKTTLAILFPLVSGIALMFWSTTILEVNNDTVSVSDYSWWGRKLVGRQIIPTKEIAAVEISKVEMRMKTGRHSTYYVDIVSDDASPVKRIVCDLRLFNFSKGGPDVAQEIREGIVSAIKPGARPYRKEWPTSFGWIFLCATSLFPALEVLSDWLKAKRAQGGNLKNNEIVGCKND